MGCMYDMLFDMFHDVTNITATAAGVRAAWHNTSHVAQSQD
jgi:hypothetical protein